MGLPITCSLRMIVISSKSLLMDSRVQAHGVYAFFYELTI